MARKPAVSESMPAPPPAEFTQELLTAGAVRVYALDAVHGQLRGELRQDPRVINLERTNWVS